MLHKLAMLHIEHSQGIHTVNNLFLSENIPEKYKKVFIIFSHIRVLIIASRFANYQVNSSNCDCKVVHHTKNTKQFFPQGKFNSSGSYSSALYPYFIHPLHVIYYQQKYCLYSKLHWKMQKMICNSENKTFACGGLNALLRSAYLLRSEFQRIILTLYMIKPIVCNSNNLILPNVPF